MGLLLSLSSFSQNKTDTISYWKVFGGYKYAYGGQVLKPRQMMDLMQPNVEAYDYMSKARTNYNVAMVLGYAGGFLVG